MEDFPENLSHSDGDDTIGDWPQRLLHVPTMTSYEWQAGHRYGVHMKPRYNAISYTWGRYQLTSALEKPYIKPLKLNGVSWEIPRIDDSHFTVDKFEELIRRSVEPRSYQGYNAAFTPSKIEFVWLDVACINQTPNHPQMATEIGRQARIFKKAKQVIVWLNGIAAQDLEKRTDGLITAAANAEQSLTQTVASEKQWSTIPGSKSKMSMIKIERWLSSTLKQTTSKIKEKWISMKANTPCTLLQGDEKWLASALENLASLIEDRWFSSLWTLQEAFLSQWAYVISGEVEALHVGSPQLRSIFTACETLHSVCERSVAQKKALNLPTANMEVQLIDTIEKGGLAALAIENPMILYTIASHRVTSRPVDRVYGIMQVFDFQLGISSPHADPGASPDLQQLELQLGRELITRYPIMSQLHVHTRPAERGQAWRVSNSSRVPALASKVGYYVTSSFLGDHKTLCQFMPTDVDDKPCASFTGRMCYFEVLQQTWSTVDRRTLHRSKKGTQSTQQIVIDSSELLPFSLFQHDPTQDLIRDARQHRLAAELVNLCSQRGLLISVLLLGLFSDDRHTEEWWKLAGGSNPDFNGNRFNIGLILVQESNAEVWSRLGICIWDVGPLASGRNTSQQRDLLEGDSNDWKRVSGVFR